MTNLIHHYGLAFISEKTAELAKGKKLIVGYSGANEYNIKHWSTDVNVTFPMYGNSDFNTTPISTFHESEFDTVVCEMIIEHLHNQKWFLSELSKKVKPGGQLLLTTENLASWPNRLMLLFGLTPFSLQPCQGKYRGGWKKGKVKHGQYPTHHPKYAGCAGHVSVHTTKVWCELVREAGFREIITHHYGLGHYVLIQAIKPL